LGVDGLFRVPAAIREVDAVCEAIVDRGEHVSAISPAPSAQAVADAIKRVLRTHQPLVPRSAFAEAVAAAAAGEAGSARLAGLVERRLSEPSRGLLADLMSLCAEIDANLKNQMKAEALAVVLAPNLLRPDRFDPPSDVAAAVRQAQDAAAVVLMLIHGAIDGGRGRSLGGEGEGSQLRLLPRTPPKAPGAPHSPLHAVSRMVPTSASAGRGETGSAMPAAPRRASWTDAPSCFSCGAEFGRFTTRRHHCRLCGNSVCGACSGSQLLMPARLCPKSGATQQPARRTGGAGGLTFDPNAGHDDARSGSGEDPEADEDHLRVCDVCARALLRQEQRLALSQQQMEKAREVVADMEAAAEADRRALRQAAADGAALRRLLTAKDERLAAAERDARAFEQARRELSEARSRLERADGREREMSGRMAEQQQHLSEALALLRPEDRRTILAALREDRRAELGERAWESPQPRSASRAVRGAERAEAAEGSCQGCRVA
jgi:hypothetical protein